MAGRWTVGCDVDIQMKNMVYDGTFNRRTNAKEDIFMKAAFGHPGYELFKDFKIQSLKKHLKDALDYCEAHPRNAQKSGSKRLATDAGLKFYLCRHLIVLNICIIVSE
jgi:hypothetical protein